MLRVRGDDRLLPPAISAVTTVEGGHAVTHLLHGPGEVSLEQ